MAPRIPTGKTLILTKVGKPRTPTGRVLEIYKDKPIIQPKTKFRGKYFA